MRKMILFAVAMFAPAHIFAEAPDFSDVSFVSQLTALPEISASGFEAEKAEAAPSKAGNYVMVAGRVDLDGTAYSVPKDGGYSMVTFNGWVNFRDASGAITNNNSYVHISEMVYLRPDQYAYETIRPSNLYVQFYRDGILIGATYMRGSLSVSGYVSGNYARLRATGYLDGQLYVEEK